MQGKVNNAQGVSLPALEVLQAEVAALQRQSQSVLDVHRVADTTSMTGSELDLLDTNNETCFAMLQFWVDLDTLQAGDTVVFHIYTDEEGTEYQVSTDADITYADDQTIERVELLAAAGFPNGIWNKEGITITADQTGGTNRDITWIAYLAK